MRDLSKSYEKTYSFIAVFQRKHIPIMVGFGSHLGARRHHGIIPFGEKDVDFQVFSQNATCVLSIIGETLRSNHDWSSLKPSRTDFGYQLRVGFFHYFDFWIFNDSYEGNHVICEGHSGTNETGCAKWYRIVQRGRQAPVFKREDFFPLKHQVFGNHKVPIPATSAELETFQYKGKPWNTTCAKFPECSLVYHKFPFVFKMTDGREQLRQGTTVLHESILF